MFRKEEYPENWRELRAAVQARAGDRCERCGIPNHAYKHSGVWVAGDVLLTLLSEPSERLRIVRVVCTTAHKPGTSKMSQDIGDLEFLCQRCHLNQDRVHHLEVQRQNRDRRRGQMELAL